MWNQQNNVAVCVSWLAATLVYKFSAKSQHLCMMVVHVEFETPIELQRDGKTQ